VPTQGRVEGVRYGSTRARVADFISRGIAAGFGGAILIDGYLLVVLVAFSRVATATGFYEFVASGAIGSGAYRQPGGVAIGVAVHFLVSVAWGVGYAYVASRTPQVRAHPLMSGVVFGIVVMIAMQLVEVAANIYRAPDSFSFLTALVGHIVFFGVPVAFVYRRLAA